MKKAKHIMSFPRKRESSILFILIFGLLLFGCGKTEKDTKESGQIEQPEPIDTDADGVIDSEDNCPEIENPEQINSDDDEFGDVCDNCPEIFNPGQEDSDSDGIGDLCEEDLPPEDEPVYKFFKDADRDGYGDPNSFVEAEEQPEGYVLDNTDCNDEDASIYPNATELCDELDNDCDESIDEEVKVTFYKDQDSDGYGDPSQTIEACGVQDEYVDNNLDQFPDNPKKVDGIDSDNDEVDDVVDNCPDIYNPDQLDFDGDEFGAACDYEIVLNPERTGDPADQMITKVINLSPDGVEIVFEQGTYNIGSTIIILDKNITMKSQGEEEAIFNNKGFEYEIIRIRLEDESVDNTVNIQGNIILDCNEFSLGMKIEAGGFMEYSQDRVDISGITIRNGVHKYSGGGMNVESNDNAKISIVNSKFLNNITTEHSGGGLYVDLRGNSEMEIRDSIFIDNSADTLWGGGICALLFEVNKLTVIGNLFSDNSANYGGGVNVYSIGSNDETSIINNTFYDNYAEMFGGGVCVSGYHADEINLINNSFNSNKAKEDRGGGICAGTYDSAVINIVNNIVSNSIDGGGMRIWAQDESEILVNNNGFDNNDGFCGEDSCHIYDHGEKRWIEDPELLDESIGENNLICDPEFVDDELRLGGESLCIDEGPPTIDEFSEEVREMILYDRDGVERPIGDAFDIGAYEVQ